MLLISLSGAWIAGILLGTKLSLAPVWLAVSALPLPFIFIFRQHKKLLLTSALLMLALLGGIVRYQSTIPVVNENYVRFYNDKTAVELKGIVSQSPDVRDKSTHLFLSNIELKTAGGWKKLQGTVLIFVPRFPVYNYGDELLVKGKLQTPQALDDFDYPGYLANQGIYSTMLSPQTALIGTGKGFRPLAWVYALRNRLSQAMAATIPEPQASLAQGMILGIRGNITPELQNAFIDSGTMHILVISGSQFNIVAGILVATGIWLFGKRRYFYIWLALAAIWIYALLTGMSPPVIRSAIMVSIFLCADLLGRQRSAITAIGFAAAVMAAITPQILGDASFQLTFMSTLGMVVIAPRLQGWGKNIIANKLGEGGFIVATANWIADSLFVTLGVTIAIWPLLVSYFGIFSVVSPLATLLVLPALPYLLFSGTLAAVIGVFVLAAGQILGWLAWLSAGYMLAVINGFAHLSFSFFNVGTINPAWIWAYFAVLGAILWLIPQRKSVAAFFKRTASTLDKIPKKWAFSTLLVIAVLTTLTAYSMPDTRLHVSFLNVGQGDAILIQTPNHQDILVDGGPSAQAISAQLSKHLPFWDRNIELVVLTHPHEDHLTGLLEVLQRYKVKQVLYLDTSYTLPDEQEWLNLIQQKHIKATLATAGQEVDLGTKDTTLEVINPTPGSTVPAMDNGIVLKLTDEKISFLLTSDISADAEHDLITQRADVSCTVLKVAHHGSNDSSTAAFLAVADPKVAVISVGADNTFGHPGAETLQRLADVVGLNNIYRTDKNGTVECITDGTRLWVRTDK
ncbi:MAG: DNA internalization-related competence protein ComEC/Rec2 [Dehalococcoidales bacterium]